MMFPLSRFPMLRSVPSFLIVCLLLCACVKNKEWPVPPDIRIDQDQKKDTVVFVTDPIRPADTIGANPFLNVAGIESVRIGSLSSKRFGMTAIEAEGQLYFAGGWGPSSVIDILDTATGRMTTRFLSQARHSIASVYCNGLIFFAGGFTSDSYRNPTNQVDILDVHTGQMRTEKLTVPRGLIAAVAMGDKVYFAGGTDNDSWRGLPWVDIYDTRSQTWSTDELKVPRQGMQIIAWKKKILFIGGRDSRTLLSNVIEIYDDETKDWSSTTMKVNASSGSVYATDLKLYIFPSCAGLVETYQPDAGEWSSMVYPGDEIFGNMSASAQQRFFIFGGQYCNYQESRFMSVFDARSSEFKNAKMAFGFYGAGVISTKNHFFVAGGTSEDLGRDLSGIFRVNIRE